MLICVGHWLLANVVFHFLMALTTSPGRPPTDTVLEQVSSICKKCISPKYREAELQKGEAVCIDRCVSKYLEIHERIGKINICQLISL